MAKYLLSVVSTSVLLTSLLLIPYISNIQALPVRDGKEMSFFNASNAIYEGNGEKLLNNKIYHWYPICNRTKVCRERIIKWCRKCDQYSDIFKHTYIRWYTPGKRKWNYWNYGWTKYHLDFFRHWKTDWW